MPDACKIVQGTAGNTGESEDPSPRVDALPLQVSPQARSESPQLPKLRCSWSGGQFQFASHPRRRRRSLKEVSLMP